MNGEKKIVDSPNAVSFKKKISFEEKEQNKHKIHCHKQSYMIESFDGGQTLRHDNQDEDQVDDVAYRPDKPVSINSSIEIISKKDPTTYSQRRDTTQIFTLKIMSAEKYGHIMEVEKLLHESEPKKYSGF